MKDLAYKVLTVYYFILATLTIVLMGLLIYGLVVQP